MLRDPDASARSCRWSAGEGRGRAGRSRRRARSSGAVLNDPAEMAKVMPGVEGFDVHDDTHWTARVVVPLGLGGLRMKIDFEKTEQREPEFAALDAKGKGSARS